MKNLLKRTVVKQFIFAVIFSQIPFLGKSISYSFSASSGTYTPLVSPTEVISTGNDVTVNNIPIGFNFNFGYGADLQVFSKVTINSNGWIALGSNTIPNQTAYATNNLAMTTIGPIIAPLWDDLSVATGSWTAGISYQTSGDPGNQVFTVEWREMSWQWGYSTPTISFQVKLYEINGDIEFIYKQESGIVHTGSASIGIANKSATDFYSLNNTSSSPTANYGTQTSNISTKPATGQIYKWSRIAPTAINNIELNRNELLVSPNPFINEMTISGNFQSNDQVFITDVLGRKIYETKITSQLTTFNISMDATLPSGIYFLNVVSDKKRVVKQIVKQ